MAAVLNNTGRLVQQIPGIQGVAAGGTALVNIPVNARYHRLAFFFTSGGAAPANLALLTSIRMLINGVNMRDITPQNMVNIAKSNGVSPANGVLPIYFTTPWRNLLAANDSNSWDLAGQATFSIQIGIGAAAVNPTLTGVMEFDYLRNVRSDGANQVPFLQPVSQHQFQINGAAGRNDINYLPFDYPISRYWVSSGAGNNITLLEVYQDGNKIVEGTPAQLNEFNAEYGILLGGANPFETGAIFDVDQRWWKSLKAANSMNLRVTLAAADTINVVAEYLPGAFQS